MLLWKGAYQRSLFEASFSADGSGVGAARAAATTSSFYVAWPPL